MEAETSRGRTQVTSFLPPPLADTIDEVRRRWDPATAERISAHVIVLYDVVNPDAVPALLRRGAGGGPFTLGLGPVRRWIDPADGIYIAVVDIDGGVARLRTSCRGWNAQS